MLDGEKTGTVRFVGPISKLHGVYAGVELDEEKGKNDGSVQGIRYFTCRKGFGVFYPLKWAHKFEVLKVNKRVGHEQENEKRKQSQHERQKTQRDEADRRAKAAQQRLEAQQRLKAQQMKQEKKLNESAEGKSKRAGGKASLPEDSHLFSFSSVKTSRPSRSLTSVQHCSWTAIW